jgi:hypothetical protein
MKRIIAICLYIFFVFSGNAQSKSPLIYGDAQKKNKRMQTAGTALTIIGGVTLFAGNVMYWKVYNDDGTSESQEDKVNQSVHIMLGGVGLMAVGIPLLTIGKTKEKNIRIEAKLDNFRGTASIKGIGIKIRF